MPLPNWSVVDAFTGLQECLSGNSLDTSTTDSVILLARLLANLKDSEKQAIIAAAMLLGVGGGGGSSMTEVAVPANSASAGNAGEYAVDENYFYIYETSVSEWRRSALVSF